MHNTMKTVAAMAFLAMGCSSSAPDEGVATNGAAIEEEASSQVDNTAINLQQLRPTDRQGIVNAPVTKPFNDAWIEDQCGGSYYVHVAVDVGRVEYDSIEVKSVTYFYVGNRYALSAPGWMDIGSNATPGVRPVNGLIQTDENGTLFQTFEVNQTFYGVHATEQGVVLSHWVNPAADYIPGLDGKSVCGMNVKTLIQVID